MTTSDDITDPTVHADERTRPVGSDSGRTTRGFKIVLPTMIARLLPLYGRNIASFFLLTMPMTEAEREYTHQLGVSEKISKQTQSAMALQSIMACFGLLIAFPWAAILSIALHLPLTKPAAHVDAQAVRAVGILTALWGIPAIASISPRRRLLASAGRGVRLVCVLGPTAPLKGFDLLCASWLAAPIYQRRRVAGVAWALTRDTALLTGRPTAMGATTGELLLWFAQNSADRRRRPVVGPFLAELMNAVANHTQIPHAHFAPADRFRSRSPRERIRRQLRTFASGALATGVLITIAAAILRIWI